MSGRAKAKMQYCQHWEQQLDSNLFVTLPPTRLKREAHFQGAAGYGCSTSHAGLLAPVASGAPEAAPSAGEPPETRRHSWGAVVSVECSSKTLPAGWQLCRKCNATAIGERL